MIGRARAAGCARAAGHTRARAWGGRVREGEGEGAGGGATMTGHDGGRVRGMVVQGNGCVGIGRYWRRKHGAAAVVAA